MTGELTDEDYTVILGPKCPDCGHRGGAHRPPIGETPGCPQWEPAASSST